MPIQNNDADRCWRVCEMIVVNRRRKTEALLNNRPIYYVERGEATILCWRAQCAPITANSFRRRCTLEDAEMRKQSAYISQLGIAAAAAAAVGV